MILDEIVYKKKQRLLINKVAISEKEMEKMAEEMLQTEKLSEASMYDNLRKPGISIIGEFKKASPSLGKIKEKIDLLDRIKDYNASADGISCLTEESYFLGSVDYLKQIREKSKLPILRKDFMVDRYQFYESKAIGADAVLLIAAILNDNQMKEFYNLSRELELDVLVETHDEWEIERALKTGARIIGVNNRNLKDFSITLDTTCRLREYVPKDRVFISESGIMNDEDVKLLKSVGVDGFLIGRAFMEAENPKALAQRWKSL